MGGGLMQLVAYGAQDVYLTGNPQITFFKVIYRRHTNFSVEQIRQTFSGESASGVGGRVIANISRNGDLVNKTYLVLPPMTNPGRISPDYGHAIIDYVEVEIGGQVIDRHYGHFMEAWAELTEPNPTGSVGNLRSVKFSSDRLKNMLYRDDAYEISDLPVTTNSIHNKFTLFQRMACAGGVDQNLKYVSSSADPSYEPTTINQELSIPLRFWFCKDPGLALPLISLQYHEVNIIFQFQPCLQHDKPELWCDYIYLDTDERRRFAQVSHEYLIEQLQLNTFEVVSGENTMICNLHFNHPVKELIWVNLNSDYWGKIDPQVADHVFWGLTPRTDTHIQKECLLKLNGHDRFEKRSMDHFTRTQPYQHHTSFGLDRWRAYNVVEGGHLYAPESDTIGVYSFCLKPEEHQPSGTCNFSRIDTVQLIITGDISVDTGFSTSLQVYAINYNVLRIMSGMGGLAYSN